MTSRQATYRVQNSLAVPHGGTLQIAYSTAVRDSIDTRAVAAHVLLIDDNNEYQFGDGEFGLAFGDTTVTVTNLTGAAWSPGTTISLGLAFIGDGFGGEFLYDFSLFVHHVTTDTYTVRVGDRGKTLLFEHASGCVVTLPKTMSEGFVCGAIARTSGPVSFVKEAGGLDPVGRDTPSQLTAQYAAGSLSVLENTTGSAALWLLAGDVE